MNYRHEFHAGNFADVFKHVVLTRVLLHLLKKETAFRYIDTHAGSGCYDLFGTEAERTAEWRGGLGKLMTAAGGSDAARELIAPYLRLAAPAAQEMAGPHRFYPGSPAIAAALLRPRDKMICCELHPAAVQELRGYLGRDRRLKIIEMDGFTGLNAFVPPLERRGVALIDPPFEAKDDLDRGLKVLDAAWRKWSTGVFLLWYPIKDQRDVDVSLRRLHDGKIKRVLRLELRIADPKPIGPLVSNGLLIVNPPFPLLEEAEIILAFLSKTMSDDPSAGHRIEWLAGE